MNKNIVITLTASESKRLIAKGVAQLPQVQKAHKEGIVSIQISSSCGYVYEEISGKQINKNNYVCGYISETGGCSAYLPALNKREFYFEKGVEKQINFPLGNFPELFAKMTHTDVLIKSGNVLANDKRVGVFVGEPDGNGGEWGKAMPFMLCKGVQVVVPMTLNKSVHVNLDDIVAEAGMHRIDYFRTHTIAGVLPLPGTVITEVDALKLLVGIDALPIAMSGVGSGEGTVTLLLKGEEPNLTNAWDLITSIKGEPPLHVTVRCGECLALKNKGQCMAQERLFR